jgi:hypothetical protein
MLHLLIAVAFVAYGQKAECATIPATTPIVAMGRFSDMQYTEEHAYGHNVELWRAGSCVFGLLEVSEGVAGDTPMGKLADLHYDARTGELHFTAKLTTGATKASDSKGWVPSRDLFRFDGRVSSSHLKGKLARSDQLRADLKPVEEDIVLRRDPEQQRSMIEARTYGKWRKATESIFRFRGPKW